MNSTQGTLFKRKHFDNRVSRLNYLTVLVE